VQARQVFPIRSSGRDAAPVTSIRSTVPHERVDMLYCEFPKNVGGTKHCSQATRPADQCDRSAASLRSKVLSSTDALCTTRYHESKARSRIVEKEGWSCQTRDRPSRRSQLAPFICPHPSPLTRLPYARQLALAASSRRSPSTTRRPAP
jgi:hypothetical protein